MIHQRAGDTSPAPLISPRRAAIPGDPTRLHALSVCLSILAAGAIGLVSPHLESTRPPVSVADAVRLPESTRLVVRGLLSELREVGGGAAVSSITDCAGLSVPVFFEEAPSPSVVWRLVDLNARVAMYRGAPELVVARAADASPVAEPAAVLEASDLARGWRALLCQPVAVNAPVLWAAPMDPGGRTVEIGLAAEGSNLTVQAHALVALEVTLNPGALVTFVGIVAASQDGRTPVLHVRV